MPRGVRLGIKVARSSSKALPYSPEAGDLIWADFDPPVGREQSDRRPALVMSRRAFCRPCLDWSERRAHLAGAVGVALVTRCFALDWITRVRDTRAVHLTQKGRRGFSDTFGIVLAP
jgi:hypothetical protein